MDIDFNTIERNGQFKIELSNRAVTGNRLLVNRFEQCFLTELRIFENKDGYFVEEFGGNAYNYIQQSYVLNELENLSGSISIAIERTITSIKNDEINSMPDTEKLSNATLTDLFEEGGMIYAEIEIVPVVKEPYKDLRFRLPITKKE